MSGRIDWHVACLPCLDQCHQDVQAIAISRALARRHQLLDFGGAARWSAADRMGRTVTPSPTSDVLRVLGTLWLMR